MKLPLKHLRFPTLLLAIFFAFHASAASAATLYFSPSSGSFTVGSILSTTVFVNTQAAAINNSDAVISFPTDLLDVVSVSKSGSIFSLWVQEPAFSNNAGTITFNGGLPTPGFTGAAGKIVNIAFRVKNAGSAAVAFSSAAVRANDGYGTDVLQARGTALFTLQEAAAPPSPPPPAPPAANTPAAPTVSSPTHPDPGAWYSDNTPKFTWDVPSGITGTRLLINHSPTSVPTVFYSDPISEKQSGALDDGVWYFHVRLRNRYGWGAVSHFRFQIDTQPPKPFKVEVKEGAAAATPQRTLVFETTDEGSGVDHYEAVIDQGSPIIVKSEYTMPPQSLGKHTVIIKAVDKAGNETLAMTEIEILAIEAPVITEYPDELLPDTILSIKGTALPGATVRTHIQKDGEELETEETTTDEDGKWSYIKAEPVEKGVYQIWVEAIDASGSKSEPSEKISILVSPPVFIRIGKLAIDYLTTTVTLLALLLAIILGVFWFWLIIVERRKKRKEEISEAEKALHKAFDMLVKNVEKQIATMDGRPGLSDIERTVCNNLRKALRNSEKLIEKEIEDIEKPPRRKKSSDSK